MRRILRRKPLTRRAIGYLKYVIVLLYVNNGEIHTNQGLASQMQLILVPEPG